jgi:hypothetical protein
MNQKENVKSGNQETTPQDSFGKKQQKRFTHENKKANLPAEVILI